MIDFDAVPRSLLTTSNPKAMKSAAYGYFTEVMHLAPARLSGGNVCKYATPGCTAACLNTAGRGGLGLDEDGLNRIQIARIRRTRYYRSHRRDFLAMLVRDLDALKRRAARAGLAAAARLNGTSDLPWERQPVTIGRRRYPNVMRAFEGVTFYDYTKAPLAMRGERGDGGLPPNYSLTFSLAEDNEDEAIAALRRDINVAVVFRGPTLPNRYLGREVIDGDLHDLRFLDPPGVIVGLRAKGRAKHDQSGFVRPTTPMEEQ